MTLFNQGILLNLEWIVPRPHKNYGNYIVIEDEKIYPVKGNKLPPVPMMFLPVPPNVPDEKPPNSRTVWAATDWRWAEAETQTGKDIIDRAAEAAEAHLENLKAARTKVDDFYRYMLNVPPLVLLINPSSFSHDMTKLILDGTFTRNGYVREHWGENLDTVSCDGKIGAFYGIAIQNGALKHEISVTRSYRKSSMSYQNLMSLVMLYENNGRVYADMESDHRITMVGSIMMFWDGNMYLGNFNNFKVSDKEEAPFSLSYSFEFTVSKIMDIYGVRNA